MIRVWKSKKPVKCNKGVVDRIATLPDSALRNIIEFAGGPLGAPVFMFSMGIGMMYTRHNSPGNFMKRGLRLLIAAYILNLVRFTGPLMALKAMGVDADYGYSVLDTFFWVDIFQFAGLSFLLMGLLIVLLQIDGDDNICPHLSAYVNGQVVEHPAIDEFVVTSVHGFEHAWYGHRGPHGLRQPTLTEYHL